jgi:Flp pilus assembly protein TadD
VLPLIYLTQGKVLAAQGETEAALAAFDQAEAEARALVLRPTAWEACLGAAEILDAVGRDDEARARRESAREMIQEIGRRFDDSSLRQAYLDNALAEAAA